MKISKKKSLPWNVVEKKIYEEIQWLKNTIIPSFMEKDFCLDCTFRQLAILILSQKIKAKDIRSTVSLWGEMNTETLNKKHGKEWHASTMKTIENYFISLNYDVTIEPTLTKGRADLGIYKNGHRNLYIEIGSVSLKKLLLNLESMEGSDFLIVIDHNHATEFSVLSANFKYQTI